MSINIFASPVVP